MADPEFVYLKLNHGANYTLHGVPKAPQGLVFTASNPAPNVPVPSALVRKNGLHKGRVRLYDEEGAVKDSKPRFLVSPRPFEAPKPVAAAPVDDLFSNSDPDAGFTDDGSATDDAATSSSAASQGQGRSKTTARKTPDA